MKLKLLLFIFIISININANISKKSFDINKDSINDRFEYYENKILIKVEEDRNNDKKIDFITLYNDKVYFKIEKQDTNYNGKFDRVLSSQKLENYKVKVITQKDNNNDGIYEVTFFNIYNSIQNDDDCPTIISTNEIDQLATDALQAVSEDGYIASGFGYKVDNSCLDQWGANFINILKETKEQGRKCFTDLIDNTQGNIHGVGQNRQLYNHMLSEDNVSIVCSETEKKFGWDGVAGHASTGRSDAIESLDINHPYISLNPNKPDQKGSPTHEEIKNIKATIFHEQLHNLGYKHGNDIEFSYACEECCFNEEEERSHEAACRICVGDYPNASSLEYIKDLIEYNKQSFNDAVLLNRVITNFIKENPDDITGLSLLASANSNHFNPVGYYIGQAILNSGQVLTEEQSTFVRESMGLVPSVGRESGEIIGRVYYELYFGDKNQAITILEENKELLKSQVAELTSSDDIHPYYNGDAIRSNIDNIIFDLWINRSADPTGMIQKIFNRNKPSDRAYDLYNYFGY